LCSKAPDVVETTLLWLKKFWGILCESEHQANTDNDVKGTLHYLVFTRWPWIRENLIVLSEFGFKVVPVEVRRAVSRLYRGTPTTLINELAINQLSAGTDITRKKDMQHYMRWRTLVSSRLAKEYGRKEAPRTLASKNAVRSSAIPKSLFNNDCMDSSFGMDFLKTITEDRSWCSPSSESWHMMPALVALMLDSEGDWTAMKMGWYASLLEVGCVFFSPENPKGIFLVCRVLPFGLILWTAKVIAINGTQWLQLMDPSVHGKKVAFFCGLDRATRCLAAKLAVLQYAAST
jgi:hypothetical protein